MTKSTDWPFNCMEILNLHCVVTKSFGYEISCICQYYWGKNKNVITFYSFFFCMFDHCTIDTEVHVCLFDIMMRLNIDIWTLLLQYCKYSSNSTMLMLKPIMGNTFCKGIGCFIYYILGILSAFCKDI